MTSYLNNSLENFNSYAKRIVGTSGTFSVTPKIGGRWVALISARAHIGLNIGCSLYIASGLGENYRSLSKVFSDADTYAPTISLSGTTYTANFYNGDGGFVGVTFLCDI